MKITKIDFIVMGHKELYVFDYINEKNENKRITIDTYQMIEFFKHLGKDVNASNVNDMIDELILSNVDDAKNLFITLYLEYVKNKGN